MSRQERTGITRRTFLGTASVATAIPILGFVASSAAAEESPNVDDPKGFNHKFAEVNGIRIHYVEEGKGPLVILVHGIPYLWYWWRHQIRALSAAGYRVVAPDLRGFGESDCPAGVPNYAIFTVVADLVDLMQSLGETSAVIVGHDLGAWVARSSVELRPDLFRGLVMVNSPIGPREAVKPSETWKQIRAATGKRFYHDYLQASGDVEMNADIRKTLRATFYSVSGSAVGSDRWRILIAENQNFLDTVSDPKVLPPWLSEQALDYYVSEYERTKFTGALNYYRNRDSNWEQSAFLKGLILQQPSMFIGGAADPSNELSATNYQQLENSLPNLRKKVLLNGVGHSAGEEQPEKVNELLLWYMAGLK
jgi:pimeloyl-ACP methyl ester carboxylesterase